jgi:hypothetical protein
LAIGAPPVLLTVTVCGALGTPGCCEEKLKLTGFTLSTGGVAPVPESAAAWVRSASVTVNVPDWLPNWAGAKTTLMVQSALPVNCAPQLFEV